MHSTHSAKNLGVVFTCLAIIGTMVVVPAHPLVQVAGENSNINVSITPGASTKFTDAYSPNPVAIGVGDTVIWTNNDAQIHTAISGTPSGGATGLFGGSPESPELIPQNKTQSHTFTDNGEFPYFCILHPSMVGKVSVGQTENGVTVRTDRSVYEIGDHVKISGKADPVISGVPLVLRIISEEGTLARVDQVSVEENGFYSYEFPIAGSLFEPNESYSVEVAYGDKSAETNFSVSRLEGGCEGLAPTILGTDRDDVLVGTDGNDVIDGLRGNDVIQGKGGDDIICGGPGFDEIHTGEGDDRAYGGRGNDELYGDLGNDRLWGGTGWDKLFGGTGDDIIFGGTGNDMLQGEEGDDRLDGQDGQDVLDGVPDDKSFTAEVSGERFVVKATDSQTIQQLTDNFNGANSMHVTGKLVRGDGGFNQPWSWHLDPSTVRMAEISIELCDGTPSMVEADLDYWLGTVGTFCPWGSKIVALGG